MQMRVVGPVLLVVLLLSACAALMWWMVGDDEPDLDESPAAPASRETPAPPAAPAATPAASAPDPAPAPSEPAAPAPPAEPALPAAAATSRLTLRVLRPDRTPVADARVVVFRGEQVLHAGSTGEDGSCEMPGSTGAASVVAAPGDTMPHRVEIASAVGKRDVLLPMGAQVAGVVRVDGAPPPQPFRLRLWGDDDVSRDPELPEKVRAALSRIQRHWLDLRAVPNAAGQFRFHGLPADWSGVLSWGHGFTKEQDPIGRFRFVELARPDSAVVLDLYRLPLWSGRVLGADREPLHQARLRIRYQSDGGERGSRGARSGADGRFEVQLPRFTIAGATVIATGPKGLARTSRRIESPPPGNRDLGDFVLAAPREIRFKVRTADGKPIAGAVAVAATNKRAHSKPTGKDGSGVIRVAADEAALDVGAIGYAVKQVTVPVAAADPLRVVLTRGTGLSVRVVTPDDRPLRRFRVRLEADRRLFGTEDGGLHPAHLYAGATGMWGGEYGIDAVRMDFRIAPGDEVRLAGLMPGVEFKLRAFHPASGFLAEETLQLGGGEWREVKLTVAEEAREVHGRVTDPLGKPIPRVEAAVSSDRELRTIKHTDKDGLFRISPVHATEVYLRVERSGYIPFVGRAATVKPGSEPSRIVLTPGNTVEVSVIDPAGRPLDEADAVVILPRITGWDGKPYRVQCGLDRGRAEVEGLPPETVTFEVELAGKKYQFPHDANRPTARFTLPAHGRVVVHWAERTALGRSRHLTLIPADDRGAEVVRSLPDAPSGRAVFESVLPGTYEIRITTEKTATEPAHLLATQKGLTVTADQTSRAAVGR